MANVRIDMQVGGIREVRSAFKSVRDSVSDLERQSMREAERAAKARAKATEREARQRIRDFEKAAKDQVKADASAAKQTERILKDATRAADRDARERVRIEERAQRDRVKAAKDASREMLRAEKAAAQESARTHRAAAQAAAKTEREATMRSRALGRDRMDMVGAAGRGFRNAAGGIMRLAGATMAIGGGFAVADVVQRSLGSEAASIGLANSMYNPSDTTQRMVDGRRMSQAEYLRSRGMQRFSNTELNSLASRVQGASGVDKTELLQGWQSYVAKSADWSAFAGKEGESNLVEMAKLAKATGSNMGEVMNAAGMLRMQNPNLDSGQLTSMMRDIVGQGKMGAVELSDLARVAGRVTASANMYGTGGGVTQATNQRRLLGLTQVAMQTSGSAEDAATAVGRFASDVGRHAKENEARGLSVLADKERGTLKDPAEILAEYFRAAKGDLTKMGEGKGNLGLGAESMKLATAMSGTYSSAYEEAIAKGQKADEANKTAAAAVKAEVSRYGSAGYSSEQIDADFKAVRAGNSERMGAAVQRITDVLETRAAPFIEKLADALERNGPKIEKFLQSEDFDKLLSSLESVIKFFAEHPFAGLAGVVAASMAKEIAAAQLGKVIEEVIMRSAGGAGGAGGAAGSAGAAGGGGGAFGTVARAAAVGTATYVAARGLGDLGADLVMGDSLDRIGSTNAAINTANAVMDRQVQIANGGPGINAEEAANLRRQYQAAYQLGNEAVESDQNRGWFDKATDYVGLTDHRGEDQRQADAAASVIRQIQALNQASGGQIAKPVDTEPLAASVKAAGEAIDSLTSKLNGANVSNPNDASRNVPLGQRPTGA